LDVNVLRGALLLELGGCRGIQPAVVVMSFFTANATLRAQLGVADGDHAQIPRRKQHHFWFHIFRAITNTPLVLTARRVVIHAFAVDALHMPLVRHNNSNKRRRL
jgi:hypothetical protein